MTDRPVPRRPSVEAETLHSGGSRWVALGILLSRITGFVRQKALAWFVGVGPHADVVTLALRTPNLLQVLLGEQTLSASFIPVYSRLVAEGRRDEARRFASAVLGILMVAVGTLVVLGILLAPVLVGVLSAGFLQDAEAVAAGTLSVDRYELSVRVVRIVFPGTGFLVISAWALGILNSHRRFLLPYLSPAVWNTTIVTVLVFAGWQSGYLTDPAKASIEVLERWTIAFAVGLLAGGVLQVGVQLPTARKILGELRPRWAPDAEGVRESFALLGPTILSRGVVQIGAWIDVFIASWLVAGATSLLMYPTLVVGLPLALFGISVAAAELPEISRFDAETARREAPARIRAALSRSWFLVVPSAIGLVLFGRLVVAVLFSGGRFGPDDAWLVALMVGAYSLGLIANAASRLLQNTFFALRDTATPARIAAARITCGAVVASVLAWRLDEVRLVEVLPRAVEQSPLHLGALGIGIAASIAAWLELGLLVRALHRRLPDFRFPVGVLAKRVAVAAVFAVPAVLAWSVVGGAGIRTALVVLPVYPSLYLAWAKWRRAPELDEWIGRRRR